jgi:hypothetical protein
MRIEYAWTTPENHLECQKMLAQIIMVDLQGVSPLLAYHSPYVVA